MDDFYAARSGLIPPLPWKTFSPPVSDLADLRQRVATRRIDPSETRYNGGLIVQDSNGDGALDPAADRIIGSVIDNAPKGTKGQEPKSPEVNGKLLLSQPTAEVSEKPGKRWGGAMMQLHFTAGSLPGKYRPTLALMKDPDDPAMGDGSAYTYTIVVE